MRRPLPALPVLLALGLVAAGCASPGGLRVQGTVADDLVVVTVPYLATPGVDLDAGFSPPGRADAASSAAGDATTVATSAGLGSFATVAEVTVSEGDVVAAGQPLVRLDDRLLRAQVRVAEAGASATAGQVAVLADRIGDTHDAEDEIAAKRADVTRAIGKLTRARTELTGVIATLTSKRAEVTRAISQLTKTRSDLLGQRQHLRDTRTLLVEQREQARQALAQLPPGAPTDQLDATIAALTAKLAEIDHGLAAMDAGLARLDAGLTPARAGLKKLNAGLKQARAGLKKLDHGLAKASDGLRKLDEARGEVRDARAQLTRLQRLAKVAAEAAAVPVDLARADLAQATVTSPVAGTVVQAVAVGDLRAPGATLVTIRRTDRSTVTTWLSPAQTAEVCQGTSASVSADWLTGGRTVTATLTRIAPQAEFPPTAQATDEVHLTRAFQLELTTGESLPAGSPVTLSIQPCPPAVAGTRR